MKKSIISVVLASVMTAVLAMTAIAGEADAAKEDKKIELKTADEVVTIMVPNDEWKQIDNKTVNEHLTDGDCEININFYKADAKLPERIKADDNFAVTFETVCSNAKYVFIVSAFGKEEDDFDEIKEAVDSITIDVEKITDEMLEHKEIVKDEYTVKDENYTAWVSSTEGLNLRDGGSTQNNILCFMPFRSKVTVTGTVLHNGTDNGWKRVNFNGVVGYASSAFLALSEPETEPETQPETQPEYIGYQYAGTDPWGCQLSVTLRQVSGGNLEWTYTEILENGDMIYRELSTPYTNGYSEWYIEGNIKDDMTYNYSGNLKLQGGGVEFTYTSGNIMEGNPENGQSASHQVGPLLDNGTNTVFLTKTNNQ